MGVEGDVRECFRRPLDCYPYFSGWVGVWWSVGGIGTKASPLSLAYGLAIDAPFFCLLCPMAAHELRSNHN